jgi:DNA-binding LytR/AlgR family response regulator
MPSCVAEDEILLRDALQQMLAQAWPELQVLAACDDGGSALEAIAPAPAGGGFPRHPHAGPDRAGSGGGVAGASPRTQVVFVTAYDQYAIDAFDKGAVDYLLKPVARERLGATVERVKARLDAGGGGSAALAELLQKLGQVIPNTSKAPPLVWLTASSGAETRLIMVDDIAYFQSDTKYTVVMTAEGESLLRKPIRELLDVLDPAIFKQIHRSTIVNLKAIASVTRDESGRGIVKLRNRPETLSVSQPSCPCSGICENVSVVNALAYVCQRTDRIVA